MKWFESLKFPKMKWVKKEKLPVWVCHGERFTYAHFVEKKVCKLLLETIAVPPARPANFVVRVYSVRIARLIAMLLEL